MPATGGLLVLALVAVVLLAKLLSHPLDSAVDAVGLPQAVVGVVIAGVVPPAGGHSVDQCSIAEPPSKQRRSCSRVSACKHRHDSSGGRCYLRHTWAEHYVGAPPGEPRNAHPDTLCQHDHPRHGQNHRAPRCRSPLDICCFSSAFRRALIRRTDCGRLAPPSSRGVANDGLHGPVLGCFHWPSGPVSSRIH